MGTKIQDIQARINADAKRKAENEWRAAVKQVAEIMQPFMQMYSDKGSAADRADFVEKSKEFFFIKANGYCHIFSQYTMLPGVIEAYQEKASEEFIAKVNTIETDILELHERIEDVAAATRY